jgi:hypothetical protein
VFCHTPAKRKCRSAREILKFLFDPPTTRSARDILNAPDEQQDAEVATQVTQEVHVTTQEVHVTTQS